MLYIPRQRGAQGASQPHMEEGQQAHGLYLAISLGQSDAAQVIAGAKYNELLNCGPNGQNALHVAALRSKELTEEVLRRQKVVGVNLINLPDRSGSTPLHYAASVGVKGVTSILMVEGGAVAVNSQTGDVNQMCPIHIAASVGAMDAIHALVDAKVNTTATLTDAKLRTFLHVAVENKQTEVVKFVCRQPWPAFQDILNMQDHNGNTALHLAVQNRDESSFKYLMGNRDVKLNEVNNNGYTPLDLASKIKMENSFASLQNPTEWMIRVLAYSGAYFSARRRDLKFGIIAPPNGSGDSSLPNGGTSPADVRQGNSLPLSCGSHVGRVHMTETHVPLQYGSEDSCPRNGSSSGNTQEPSAPTTDSVLVASALIATVTFAAAVTVPGSYKLGGTPNAGTPELGSHYGFKVFLVADILACYCSVAATFSLAAYGTQGHIDPLVRRLYAKRALWLFHVALKSVIVAFALGISIVMWDISIATTIIVAVAATAFIMYGNEALAHDIKLMKVMRRRFGFKWSWNLNPSTSSHLDWNTRRLTSFSATVFVNIFNLCWAYVLIFVLAVFAQKVLNKQEEFHAPP